MKNVDLTIKFGWSICCALEILEFSFEYENIYHEACEDTQTHTPADTDLRIFLLGGGWVLYSSTAIKGVELEISMAEETHLHALYSKLYHKYNKMKKEKDTVMEKLNQDQEMKFMSYVKASDDMIEFLKSENDALGKQVCELIRDLSLIRSTKDEECIKYQTLLMEENQKNRELSEEIEKLCSLQRKGCCCQARDNQVDDGDPHMPGSSQCKSSSSGISKKTRKRNRQSAHGREDIIMPPDTEEVECYPLNESANRSCKHISSNDSASKYNHPACCKRKTDNSCNAVTDCGPASCFFQDLAECIVGLKLTSVVQNEEFGVSVLHPSSGYSFSLTWINNSHGEPELLYRLLSLGTFERVAPEWLKDEMMFSTSMCPVFFQRVSKIIKLSN